MATENYFVQKKTREQIVQIARCEIVLKCAYATDMLRVGLMQSGFKISRNILVNAIDTLVPSANKVIQSLSVPLHVDFEEDKVLAFFKLFIESCDCEMLANLLRFITGTDALLGNINIDLNSLLGNECRVTANTCSKTVHLPKTYSNYFEFSNELKSILRSSLTWVFDSI